MAAHRPRGVTRRTGTHWHQPAPSHSPFAGVWMHVGACLHRPVDLHHKATVVVFVCLWWRTWGLSMLLFQNRFGEKKLPIKYQGKPIASSRSHQTGPEGQPRACLGVKVESRQTQQDPDPVPDATFHLPPAKAHSLLLGPTNAAQMPPTTS